MQPTSPSRRIIEIDILRGIAVLWMILWNFRSRSMGNYYVATRMDHVVAWVMAVVDIENVTHLLFAFIFGLGLALRAHSHAEEFALSAVSFRRLLGLFIMGIANLTFLYRPDILHVFAVLGFILLFFLNLPQRVVLASAVLMVGLPSFVQLALSRLMVSESYVDRSSYDSLKSHYIQLSSYSDLVLMRAEEWVREYVHPSPYVGSLEIFAMFLFGLYAVRRGLLENITAEIGFIQKITWGSLVVYMASQGWVLALQQQDVLGAAGVLSVYRVLSLNNRPEIATVLVRPLSVAALTLLYIGIIVQCLQHDRVRTALTPLANVGRLAVSIYIFHGLIGTALFYGVWVWALQRVRNRAWRNVQHIVLWTAANLQ
jgi:uncharacterized protein